MKILLDEQLPVKLKYRFLPELNVSTVRDEQWLGIKNGVLIQSAINAGFNILITNDQNLGFQQKLVQFKILFINLHQPSNRYEDILAVIISIKQWLIKQEANIEKQIEVKNYLIYPNDFS